MAKSIKELKKENTFLKSKSEKSDVMLIELVDEVWLACICRLHLSRLFATGNPSFFMLLLTCKHGFLPVLKLHELLSMLLSSTSCKGCVCPPSVLSSNVEFKLYIKKAFCPNYNWLL